MTEPRYCPRCHSALAGDAPGALCPNCLMQLALEPSTDSFTQVQEAETLNLRNPLTSRVFPEARRIFGDYELLHEIARGGMGIVFKARQLSLNRIVALKLMLPGLLSSEAELRRFRAEAEAVAQLQHPNIVAVHEVGELDGQQYFSMDYVEGESLAVKIKDHPLPAATAVMYVKTVAEAIHYAHEQGILHRDLKPSNVLTDKSGQPRVTDFGLAKRIESDLGLTATGVVLGTPSYMPPEQAEGKNNQLSPASDVYSLGAMLYELLIGRPPFQAATPLDTVLLALNSGPAPPRLLNPTISRDLETICLKCLEKDARKRYLTAQDLSDDLGRYLTREPIKSRPISRLSRAWRWCRRNPWPTVATVALALLVVVILVTAINSRARLRQLLIEQARAERGAGRRGKALDLLAEAARIKRAPELRQEAIQTITSPGVRPRLQIPIHTYGIGRSFYFSPDSKMLALDYDCRTGSFTTVSSSSDKRQAGASNDGAGTKYRVGIWDTQSGRLSKIVDDHPEWHKTNEKTGYNPPDKRLISESANGRIVILCPFSHRNTGQSLEVWDITERRLIGKIPDNNSNNLGVLLNDDGRIIVIQDHSNPNVIQIWDVTGSGLKKRQIVLASNAGAYIQPGGISPDGSMLAAFSALGKKGGVSIWDTVTGTEITRLPDNHTPVWSGDGNFLATWGPSVSGTSLIVAQSKETSQQMDLLGCGLTIKGALGLQSGTETLGVSVERSVVNMWEILNPTSTYLLSDQVDTLSFNNRHNRLASNSVIWDVIPDGGSGRLSLSQQFLDRRVLFNGPGQLWLIPTNKFLEFPITIQQAAPDEREIILKSPGYWGFSVSNKKDAKIFTRVHDFSFSPDGKSVLTTGQIFTNNSGEISPNRDSILELWDLNTQERRAIWHKEDTHNSFTCARFSPDGKRVATCGNITVWDAEKGKKLNQEIDDMNSIVLAFSPDSRLVYFGGYANSNTRESNISVVETETGRELGRWRAHQGDVTSLVVSRDGQRLASGGEDEAICVWDVKTRSEIYRWAAHPGRVTALMFSSDDRTLTSGGEDGSLKMWNLRFIDKELQTLGLTLDRFSDSELYFLCIIGVTLGVIGQLLSYLTSVAEKLVLKVSRQLPLWLKIIGEAISDIGFFMIMYITIEDGYALLFIAIWCLSMLIWSIRRIASDHRKKRLLKTEGFA